MNAVEKLLQTLCPHGVEFRKLGEVCEFQNGFAFQKKKFKNTGLPIVRISNIQHNILSLDEMIYFHPADYKGTDFKPFEVKKGDILIAMSGATTGKIGILTLDTTVYLNQRVGKFKAKSQLNNKFLYYFLLTKTDLLYSLAGGGAQPNLSSNQILKQIKIPLPPLEVQREIVKILDTFTQLNTELNTELKLRKKQYEYYRNWLLSFGDVDASKEGAEQRLRNKSYPKALKALLLSLCPHGVEFRKLGEVINICKGKQLNKEFLSNYGEYPVMNGGIYASGYWNTYNTNSPKIIISQGGASAGYVNYMTSKFWAGAHCYVIESDSKKVNYKFLFYFLKNKESFLIKSQFGAGIPALNKADIETLPIPLPPLEVQREIVKILDDFSTLTEDLSSGIPAEIAARKKQYEYYRDKLLTFTPLIKEGE
ncbi:anti-codon nuclease masking agent (prrB) [Helicobacter mustelae]|uniref:restriction endonuclease subunit S n=1 Tax=Helicobacter mustelae TaxID=217 RepID=UPI000E02C521|nr:restriction endonuclease subunit S [Helicobacter mustelae]STP14192.1 anti-codon nuclease masking agent (prrB) [Helicobacter mustelae]